MTQWTAGNYRNAGIATASRQASFAVAEYAWSEGSTSKIKQLLSKAMHKVQLTTTILEAICGYSIILVEQTGYPLLLQITEELDRMMERQIPLEQNQLNLFKAVHPLLLVPSSLAWISLGNYIEGFEAQIYCHQKVLEHFQSLWEYKTTKINYVVDGDTIYVDAYAESVRIEGINCPELGTDEGEAAKEFVKSKWLNKEVELRARKELDVYGRRIAKVYYKEKNIAYEIVIEGHGKFIFWHFP